MNGDSLHILQVDLPLALVLVAPWLLVASTCKNRNAPLVVPAVILFVLGLSSLYVVLVEEPIAEHPFPTFPAGSELLRHHHDLAALAGSTMAAAILLSVIGLLYWDVITTHLWRNRVATVFTGFAVLYGAGAMWLMTVAHQGASLARHLSQHAPP